MFVLPKKTNKKYTTTSSISFFAQKMQTTSTKRRRQQDTKTNTTAHQATTTAVQMVLSLPRLIACILQYYTDNIVVLCKLHSVNKLFRSVLTSPVHAAGMIRVINLLHLENIESLDETQVLWALQTCHMSLVEIRIQNQNITKLLELVHSLSFPKLERVYLVSCSIPWRSSTSNCVQHLRTWTAHLLSNPHFQWLNLNDTTYQATSIALELPIRGKLTLSDWRVIEPEGMSRFRDHEGGYWKLWPCENGCGYPCIPEYINLHATTHQCDPNQTYPCFCKLPRVYKNCDNCYFVICQPCANKQNLTMVSIPDIYKQCTQSANCLMMISTCHLCDKNAFGGTAICNKCFHDTYDDNSEQLIVDKELAKCNRCQHYMCDEDIGACSSCNLGCCNDCYVDGRDVCRNCVSLE
jgi:hypothetical protein